MRDFTLHTYLQLLSILKDQEYIFVTLSGFLKNYPAKCVILRHDVDRRKLNSLTCARLENELGITGTYYFRIVPESFDVEVIKAIANFDHEIGYHYEDLKTAHGNSILAIKMFEQNIAKLRRVVPIETICMHGSPLSKYDNRELWKKYNYRDFGIIGEPYFDINFNKVLYLTDTGRRWDGESVNIRDKFSPSPLPPLSSSLSYRFHSTFDIIKSAKENNLPARIMLTIHPQRWENRILPWMSELVWQNIKNIGKWILNKAAH